MSLVSSTIPNLIGGVSQQPYTIRMASQCAAMENCLPSVVEFLRRRPATRHIGKILDDGVTADAAVHAINRDKDEQYILVALDNTLRIFDLTGREKELNFTADPAYLKTDQPSRDLAFLTVNDYTFIANRQIRAARDESVPPLRQPEALVFVKQASYATDYNISLDDTAFSHTTYKDDNRRAIDGKEYSEKNGFNMNDTDSLDAGRYKLSSTVIAGDLADQIKANGDYDCRVVKSSLWIRRKDGEAFTATVSDSRSNTHLAVTSNQVQRMSDLPLVAPDGYTAEVIGDQDFSFDNYYVKFVVNEGGGDFDNGVWKETVKPGIPDSLDASTLPHALVREADGTFNFKTLDWGKRKAGDADSAPDPTFVGRTINSLFLYRNRLGFLAGDNAVMSEAGKFFNFYPTTVTTMIDSDPIDVAAGADVAVTLHHACAFSEGMVLFSDKNQFALEHDEVMSPKTTAIVPTTAYECSTLAAPVGAGKNIFFAIRRGNFAGVREFLVEETDGSLLEAPDITSHVPHYIDGEIHKLVSSSNEDILLALPDRERDKLAVYKYFWNGKEKVQSAWSKWLFSGEVLAAAFLDSSLILVMKYEDGVYLERMRIEPSYADDGAPFEAALDRKISERDLLALEYDEAAKISTLTFPYPISTGQPGLISRYPEEGEASFDSATPPPGVVWNVISHSGNQVRVAGDLRDEKFLAGVLYRSRYEFSPQIVREGGDGGGKLAVVEGRLQLRNFTLTYADTGYFETLVTPEYRDTDRRIFSGRILGHGSNLMGRPAYPSGTWRFPVLCRAESGKIEITSQSPLPFQITSAGWEGYYHLRSRRI